APPRSISATAPPLFGRENEARGRAPDAFVDLDEEDGFEDEYRIDYAWDQRPEPPRPPRAKAKPAREAPALRVGLPARHASFGVGMIEAIDGDKVPIRFPGVGVQRVGARSLEPLG